MMDPATPQYLRAPVIGHTLWVTRHDDDERWPCGKYPTQSTVDTGLTEWIKDDEPLENADVVLWYVFGIHHITRVEEWPIMPVDTISFWLKPFGFFDQNPSIDVAPSAEGRGWDLPHRHGRTPRRRGGGAHALSAGRSLRLVDAKEAGLVTKSPNRSHGTVLDVGHGRALLGKGLLLDFHRERRAEAAGHVEEQDDPDREPDSAVQEGIEMQV